VTDRDSGRHAEFVDRRAEPQPERLHADEIDFLLEQPARIVLAESVGRDERQVLEFRRIGLQVGTRLQRHVISGEGGAVWRTRYSEVFG